jgi:hypothetical protein
LNGEEWRRRIFQSEELRIERTGLACLTKSFSGVEHGPSSTTLDDLVAALAAPEALVRHVAAIELAKVDPELLPEA